jgi:transposase
MTQDLVSDVLWGIVEPLLPKVDRRFRYPGRKRVDDRVALQGILFVLKTGIPWEDFPKERGCSGMTLWRRLKEWQEAGVWDKLDRILRRKPRNTDLVDWARSITGGRSVPAAQEALEPAATL